jgi:uncharacterized protein YjbI with pentapeptide repeats
MNKWRAWVWKLVCTIKKHRSLIIVIISLLILGFIAWVQYLNYEKGYVWADWTGFGDYETTTITKIDSSSGTTIIREIHPGKTLWDWFGIIFGLAITILITILNNENEKRRKQTETNISIDQQREASLQNYLDKLGELLIKEQLLEKKDIDKTIVRVAQVRTLTTLKGLDTNRQNLLIQFLRDANLLDFILKGASLSNANLECINLEGAHLEKANLRDARMNKANLSGIHLEGAHLERAMMEGANLKGAFLAGAFMMRTHLEKASLRKARIIKANLDNVYLERANMMEAHLEKANLYEAHLKGADLNNTHLEGANLKGAIIDITQLSKAYLSQDTKMPNGSNYDGRFSKIYVEELKKVESQNNE